MGTELWITKGNWINSFGAMFLSFRDAMQNYFLRLIGQVERQAQVNRNPSLVRSSTNALKVYVKESRRADKVIPEVLRAVDRDVQNVEEYDMIDVNDYVKDVSRMQRHRYLLQLQQGLSVPIFCYTWMWGGSRAGMLLNPLCLSSCLCSPLIMCLSTPQHL